MHIEIQVEEPSAEKALSCLLPKLIGDLANFTVVNYRNKQRMLRKLPDRLKAYARRMNKENIYVVVLIDRDRDDCLHLKARLEDMARNAGLTTKSSALEAERFTVVNRIAVEELEAWFFGDQEALRQAYPKLPDTFSKKRPYRHPDAIKGGTWETLERLLQRHGYYPQGYPKIEGARSIAEHMEPDRNSSPSFQAFKYGLEALMKQTES